MVGDWPVLRSAARIAARADGILRPGLLIQPDFATSGLTDIAKGQQAGPNVVTCALAGLAYDLT